MAEGTCWPLTDHLFDTGIKALMSRLDRDDFFFINLNESTLHSFLLEIPVLSGRENIIVCSDHLMPLANYLLDKQMFVFAVFESCTTIELISRVITIYQHNEKICIPRQGKCSLSKNEFRTLLYMVKGLDVRNIAHRYDLKSSTVYTYRKRVSEKLKFCRPGHPFY